MFPDRSVLHCVDHCWLCNNAADIATCRKTTTTCNAGEECFLENFINSLAQTRYNAGCRTQALCRVMEVVSHGKRSADPCGQCCTGPGCQEHLCGSPSVAETNYRCLDCASVSSSGSCTQRITCQDTEVCSNSVSADGAFLRYSFGCEQKHICAEFAAHGRRSAITICSSCCVGDECNKADCFQLAQNMTREMFGR
ncbi:uncharacterized protein LOC117341528 isoform X2 [Pecten maximus]|uniref:uncharacterized protein LOC117341528 isoform X2 n=1 Tax=Pecten maximus TaxID=6579 RepID=UPI001458FBB9|nr:uncharacterized protein LOC117341528 isoform X2 [Pecten maximus]